jgi:integrase
MWRVENALKLISDVLYKLLLVAARTGLRIGGIIAVERADVDFKGSMVKGKGKTVYFLSLMV